MHSHRWSARPMHVGAGVRSATTGQFGASIRAVAIPPARGRRARARVLLSSTAITGALAGIVLLAALAAMPAHADGGAGGNGFAGTPGAGGAGFTGQAGGTGTGDAGGGGGAAGGPASGGTGGDGGTAVGGGAVGTGGTSATPNGGNGNLGVAGGTGGGGGFSLVAPLIVNIGALTGGT